MLLQNIKWGTLRPASDKAPDAGAVNPAVERRPDLAGEMALSVIAQTIVVPTVLSSGTVQERLGRILTTAAHLRTACIGERGKNAGHPGVQRSNSVILAARRRGMKACPALGRILSAHLEDIACSNREGEGKERGIPTQVYNEWLRASGWAFGPWVRNRTLERLVADGRLRRPMTRWYAAPDPVPTPRSFDAALLHLSRFLGSLTRSVLQRFLGVAGSTLLGFGARTAPARVAGFCRDYRRWLHDWMDEHSVPWSRIPPGEAHDFVMLNVGLLGSAPSPVREDVGKEDRFLADMLVTDIVGGDLVTRLGNIDVAASILQRALADAMMHTLRRDPEDTHDSALRRRFAITLETLRRWQEGPRLDPAGELNHEARWATIPGAESIVDILSGTSPRALSANEIIMRLCASCLFPPPPPTLIRALLDDLVRMRQLLVQYIEGRRHYHLPPRANLRMVPSPEEEGRFPLKSPLTGPLRDAYRVILRALQEAYPHRIMESELIRRFETLTSWSSASPAAPWRALSELESDDLVVHTLVGGRSAYALRSPLSPSPRAIWAREGESIEKNLAYVQGLSRMVISGKGVALSQQRVIPRALLRTFNATNRRMCSHLGSRHRLIPFEPLGILEPVDALDPAREGFALLQITPTPIPFRKEDKAYR